jgi:hypothetical protein
MGHVTPLIASTSAVALIELLVLLGLLFLDYWATMRIITQAGYSSAWILLPLAPLVLTIICLVIWWNDIHEIYFGGGFDFGGIGNVRLFWRLDEFSIILNWVFYLIFAFSRWPAIGTSRASDAAPLPPPPPRAIPGSRLTPPTPTVSPPGARVMPSSAASPGAAPANTAVAPAATRPSAKCCAWCGEALPGSRALFHDCGSKDRPEAFCTNCGNALPAGSTQCSSCGAA